MALDYQVHVSNELALLIVFTLLVAGSLPVHEVQRREGLGGLSDFSWQQRLCSMRAKTGPLTSVSAGDKFANGAKIDILFGRSDC